MSKLTREDILKLAGLSRLRLSPEEVEKFIPELSEILSYVEILGKADAANLQPTYQVTGLQNVFRPDVPKDYGYEAADLLKNAPAVENGQFKVKRVLE